MITHELVASGLGFLKPFNNALIENQNLLNELKTDIVEKAMTDNGYFSMLFNAYVEPPFGKNITKYYRKSIYHRHADSGGLQAITLGDVIDDDMKNSVYEIQSKYADIGMSFDEIPIIRGSERSSASTLNNRTFDYSNLNDYIKRSVDNLISQIMYFEKQKSECNAMYILHGNCYDTLMKWYDESIKLIPKDLHCKIGGLALTDSAMGNGFVEDVIQAFAMQQIIPEFKKFHLLGIGSVKRLIPYIIALKNTNETNLHLSYDSTSLTQGVGYGRFYEEGFKHNLSREYNEKYFYLKQLISKELHDINDLSDKEFHKIINSNSSYYFVDNDKKKSIDISKQRDYYRVIFSYFFISVKNFIKDVDSIINSSKKLTLMSENFGISKERMFLENMKTINDLNRFEREFSKKSKKIPSNIESNLEGFLYE